MSRAVWLFVALVATLLGACSGRPDPPRGWIVVVSDSLRAQELGLYGYDRDTTPFLDSLAARALVYEDAYSHYSYTWPTVANLFTSQPFSALVRTGGYVTPRIKGQPSGGLTEKSDTLAEILVRHGVRARAVTANPWIADEFGYGQGFEEFHDATSWDPGHAERRRRKFSAAEVNTEAFRMLEDFAAGSEPWFLYLHYFDTHMSYHAPEEDRASFVDPTYARKGRIVGGAPKKPDQSGSLNYLTDEFAWWIEGRDIAQLVSEYDAELHYFDRQLSALFARLEELGLASSTGVVVTSDHGEAFFERRYWGHGFLSREEEQHVPLLVVQPGAETGRRVAGATSTHDVFHATLGWFGVSWQPVPNALEPSMDLLSGASLVPAAYSEGPGDTRIIRDGRHSLYRYYRIEERGYPLPVENGEFLFDRESDPGERRNLLEDASRAGRPRRQRDALLEHAPGSMFRAAGGAIDPMFKGGADLNRRLRELGYIE